MTNATLFISAHQEDFLGDILLSLCHQPEKNTITVTIVEMKLKKCPAHEHISKCVLNNLKMSLRAVKLCLHFLNTSYERIA